MRAETAKRMGEYHRLAKNAVKKPREVFISGGLFERGIFETFTVLRDAQNTFAGIYEFYDVGDEKDHVVEVLVAHNEGFVDVLN